MPNLLDTLEPLLLVLVLISPEFQYLYLSLAAAGSLDKQQYISYSYPTGHLLQWKHDHPKGLLFLILFCCYSALCLIHIFFLLHVDPEPHLPQNIVYPLHPHRNSMAPFICNYRSHQIFLPQTSESCKGYFPLYFNYVPHGLHLWVHLKLKTNKL